MSDWRKRAVPVEDWRSRASSVAPLTEFDRSFDTGPLPPPEQSASDLLKEDRPLGKVARTLIDTAPGAAVARKASEGFAPTTQTGTALRSFGQGAGLGLTDEAAGVLGAVDELEGRYPLAGGLAKGALAAASPIMGAAAAMTRGAEDYPSESLVDALKRRYGHDRDLERRDIKAGAAANPGTAFVSEAAGNLALPLPGPGKVKTVGDFAKTAGAGALGGGVMGFGKAEGDAGAQALNTGAGMALGGLMTPVAGAVATKAGDALRPMLMKKAEENVIRAINNPGIADRLRKVLKSTDPEVHRAFARRLLDKGVVGFGDSAENIASKAASKIDELGEGIGAYIDSGAEGFARNAAAVEARNAAKQAAFAPEAQRYGEALNNVARGQAEWEQMGAGYLPLVGVEQPPIPLPPRAPVAPTLESVPTMAGEFQSAAARMHGALSNEPEAIAALGRPAIATAAERIANEPNPSMRHLFRAKSGLQGGVNYDEMAPEGAALYRDSVRNLKEAAHDTLAKGLSGDDLENFLSLNAQYSDQAKLLELAANKASRESGKKVGTLAGTTAAGHAAELLGGPGGAAVGLGVKAADNWFSRRGPATLAVTQNALAKTLPGSPAAQYLAGQGVKFAALKSLLESGPDAQKEESSRAAQEGGGL